MEKLWWHLKGTAWANRCCSSITELAAAVERYFAQLTPEKSRRIGATLLTGYLGGAVASHVPANDLVFPIIFPIVIGVLVWGSLYLRDERLRALIPLRQ